jgi:hypothetical protein
MVALWSRIKSFFKKKNLPEYQFVDSDEEHTWIKITTGNYAGVIYSYGMIGVDETLNIPILRFNYFIHDSGQHDIEHLKNNQEFVNIIGDLLTEIIIKNNEQIRKNDSEEFDL